jgi:hypothetical protein
MPTKVELLEQNSELLKNAIAGWANRIVYLISDCEIEQRVLDNLSWIVDEMRKFSGE